MSSTFTDLVEERDALQRHVFPRLRELCASHGARFQAIDLRWGVSEEAGVDQRTIPICLTEVERCQRPPRPNFVVLLGDRYGWRPLPAEIPEDEYLAIEDRVTAEEKELLERWYKRDDNALDRVYCLLPRTGELESFSTWEERVERPLHAALVRATEGMPRGRRLKYVASATEQEIVRGALEADEPEKHVFAFFRTIGTDDGPLAEHVPPDGSAGAFVDQGGGAHGRLTDLKKELGTLLGDHVHCFEARWVGKRKRKITRGHVGELPGTLHECLRLLRRRRAPRTLCVAVWKDLAGIILQQLDELESHPPLEQEIESHRAFGRERIEFEKAEEGQAKEFFVGRSTDLETIREYLRGSEPQPLGIVGEGGSGKSALMAKAAKEAEEESRDAAIVVRFVGATPGSSDIRTLLDGLCREIARSYGEEETAPTLYTDLVAEFRTRLALATAERPLVVFLDALDQLSDAEHARELAWLPGSLPEHVRVVVSMLPGDSERALGRKHPAPPILGLGALRFQEGERLLDSWLSTAGRTLEEHQRRQVLEKFDASGRLPLYLKLAFEEARLWRSYAEASDTVLHKSTRALIRRNLFRRLADPANHGPVLVSRSLGYLAASRHGLSEDELLDVLSADEEVFADFTKRAKHSPPERRLPVVVWSRLYFDLEPYLVERSADGVSLLGFYHRQLGDVARKAYLRKSEGRRRNGSLADYFLGKADPTGDRSWRGGSERGLAELPYHLGEAGRLDDLFETLTDFRFLEHKAAEVGVVEQTGSDGETTRSYTGVFQLQDDFERALRRFGGGQAAAQRPLIVTAVDFRDGNGFVVRCPWCNTLHTFEQECSQCKQRHDLDAWRGRKIACPNKACKGPLKVNDFVVGDRA